MRQRIYTDTSVIGGCEDEEFSEWSIALMNQFISGMRILVLSSLTLDELESAPAKVKSRLEAVPTGHREKVELSDQARDLADAYLAARVISKKSIADAQHIAAATLARADVLVSWYFKHIVDLTRIEGYNSVNAAHGHLAIEIRTPRELLGHE